MEQTYREPREGIGRQREHRQNIRTTGPSIALPPHKVNREQRKSVWCVVRWALCRFGKSRRLIAPQIASQLQLACWLLALAPLR